MRVRMSSSTGDRHLTPNSSVAEERVGCGVVGNTVYCTVTTVVCYKIQVEAWFTRCVMCITCHKWGKGRAVVSNVSK